MAQVTQRYERVCGHVDDFHFDDADGKVPERRTVFLRTNCRKCQQAHQPKPRKKAKKRVGTKAWYQEQRRQQRLDARSVRLADALLQNGVLPAGQGQQKLACEIEGSYKIRFFQ